MALEGFGDLDGAVGLLVGLDEGDEEAGEGGARAVEGVAEAVLPVRILVAQVHAAGLIVSEVAATGHFEVVILARCPDFDVVSFGGTKSDIATAELDHSVVEAELLEDGFGVGGEFVEFVEGVLRGGDFDEFHFVKLVHADESAGAESGAAGFATEAGGVAAVLDGQSVRGDDLLTMEVGDRNLGGGDEVKRIVGASVELVGELG